MKVKLAGIMIIAEFSPTSDKVFHEIVEDSNFVHFKKDSLWYGEKFVLMSAQNYTYVKA